MADYIVTKGATSVILDIFIQDSTSTTGAGLTGLAFNTASLVCYRARSDDGNAGGTSISLATATLGTWSTGGFKEKDATNMPGWYEFGIPNNAVASGSNFCGVLFKGAANMVPLPVLIQLTTVDFQDAALGITNIAAIKTQTDKMAFTVTNQIDANVLDWKSATAPAMTGDAFARLGAPAGASVSADVAAVKTDTASLITTIGAAGAGLTAVALTAAYNFAKGTVAMTESYPSLHAAYTPAQAFFMIVQKLYERSVSSTTETINGVDGSTPKMTETLNSATVPTAVTRAS